MINYKLEISKLEKLATEKLCEVKILRDEISLINTKISEYSKLHQENNKSSIQANEILSGYDKKILSDIVLYFMKIFTDYGTSKPKSILNKIDYEKAIKDEEFFNQVIIALGRPTIEYLFKNFSEVHIDDDGETYLMFKNFRKKDENLGKRLFSKLTKKSLEDYIVRQGYIK